MKQILLFSLIVFNFIALQTAQAANGLTITRWSTHHSHIDPYGAEGQRITSFQDELKKLQFHTLSSYTIIFFSRTCGYLREGEIFRPRCYEVRDAKGKLVAFIITNPTIPYQVERSILHVAADIDEQGRKVLHKLLYETPEFKDLDIDTILSYSSNNKEAFIEVLKDFGYAVQLSKYQDFKASKRPQSSTSSRFGSFLSTCARLFSRRGPTDSI